MAGVEPERFGNAHPSLVPYETFEAADGWVNLAVGSDQQFRAFCAEAGAPELADDQRYATNAGRVGHRERARAAAAGAVPAAHGGRVAGAVRPRPRARRPDPDGAAGGGGVAVGDRRPRPRDRRHGAHVPLADRARRRAPAPRTGAPPTLGQHTERGAARARLRRRANWQSCWPGPAARAESAPDAACGGDLRAPCVECSTRGHPSPGASGRRRNSPTGPTRPALDAALETLRGYPPLVFAGEARALHDGARPRRRGPRVPAPGRRLRGVVRRLRRAQDPRAAARDPADVGRPDLLVGRARDQGRPHRRASSRSRARRPPSASATSSCRCSAATS